MIRPTKLPDELIDRTRASHLQGHPEVRKRSLESDVTIEVLNIKANTKIKRRQNNDQWEAILRTSNQTAYINLKGEPHEISNGSGLLLTVMIMKGKDDYTYEELAEFFRNAGYTVSKGSLIT